MENDELLEIYKEYEIKIVTIGFIVGVGYVNAIIACRNGKTIYGMGQEGLEKKKYKKSTAYYKVISAINMEESDGQC